MKAFNAPLAFVLIHLSPFKKKISEEEFDERIDKRAPERHKPGVTAS